jgi:DNA-binding CsgD family transcriptional regulator
MSAAFLHAIERACDADLTAQKLLETVAEPLHSALRCDGFFLAAADPETALCMGAGIVHGMPDAICQPMWDHEFLVPDFNKFADLASAPSPVGDLHEATGGRPQRSARYREFRVITGFDAELRAAFTSGGSAWGIAQINRADDQPRFTADEIAWLERASRLIGRGLRRALLSQSAAPSVGRGPGMIVVGADGVLVSATPEAEAWLREIDSSFYAPNHLGVPLPVEAFSYVAAARAGMTQFARGRVRTRTGVWLMMHASCLRDASGEASQTALVIEPAKASDVAPIVIEAYELTERELDVTRLVARGLKTGEIAEKLFLSPHTVRDHVKAIFEKVGVTSRGELTAKLFADHYSDSLHEALETADVRLVS